MGSPDEGRYRRRRRPSGILSGFGISQMVLIKRTASSASTTGSAAPLSTRRSCAAGVQNKLVSIYKTTQSRT
ncbi:hypothetical protein L209DRAFT_750832 [Thermothelomyces heterothallicus CBS 203.75]